MIKYNTSQKGGFSADIAPRKKIRKQAMKARITAQLTMAAVIL
jgi:hypothetical protein